MEVFKGRLLNVRRWDMTDQPQGQKGITVRLSSPIPESQKSSEFYGEDIHKFSGEYEMFLLISADWIGKKVKAECNMIKSGESYKPRLVSLTLDKPS